MNQRAELELIPRIVYDGDGNQKVSEVYELWSRERIGAKVACEIGAPGCGLNVYRITRITPSAVYGIKQLDPATNWPDA